MLSERERVNEVELKIKEKLAQEHEMKVCVKIEVGQWCDSVLYAKGACLNGRVKKNDKTMPMQSTLLG